MELAPTHSLVETPSRAFYRLAMEVLTREQVPFLVGGTFAFVHQAGIDRSTTSPKSVRNGGPVPARPKWRSATAAMRTLPGVLVIVLNQGRAGAWSGDPPHNQPGSRSV